MATAASTNLEDILNCTICLETFTKPKVLPCQHSFCYACLMLLGKKRTIKCPLCQQEHQIPDSGISGFKDNFLLAKLLDVPLPKLEICADCEGKSTAVNDCEHCGQKLCSKCLVGHMKLSMELSVSLKQLKDDLQIPASEDQKVKFENFRIDIEGERRKMREVLEAEAIKKLTEVKTLLERANFLDRVMGMTCQIYNALGHGDSKAEKHDNSCVSELLAREPSEYTSVGSLTDFRNDLEDLKTLLRLIKTEDGQFRFNYTTDTQHGLEKVEFEEEVVDIQGKYASLNILEQIGGLLGETTDDFQHPRTQSKKVAPVASQPKPPVAAQRKCRSQNQLPRYLDYKSFANDGSDVVCVIEGQSVEDQLNYPRACAYHMEKDLLYVDDCTNQRIMVYGGDGKNGRVFYKGVKQPRDLAVSTDGKYLYIAAANALLKVDMKGELVKSLKQYYRNVLGWYPYQNCRSVTCYQEFTIVLDEASMIVIVYDDCDQAIRHFKCGSPVGRPVAVAISDYKKVYIADETSSCIHVYGWKGEYLDKIVVRECDDDITGIAVDGDGNVCISRYNSSDRIVVFNRQTDTQVSSIGGPGTELGKFDRPHGPCFTSDGRLAVVDCHNHRVQIIRIKKKEPCK